MKHLKISENCKYYLMFLVFSLISVFFIELSYFYFNLSNTFNWILNNIYLYAISTIIIMTFMVFLFSVFRHVALAIFIPTLVSISYGVGLYIKLVYREAPALPYEISMILDLKQMLEFLNDLQRVGVYLILIISIIVLILLFKYEKRKDLDLNFRITNIVASLYVITMLINYNTRNTLLFIVLNIMFFGYMLYALKKSKSIIAYKICSLLLICAIVLPSYNGNTVKKLISYKVTYPDGDFVFRNFKYDGVIPAFLSYANLDYVNKPEKYTKDEIAKIVNKYKEVEAEQNKNKTDLNTVKPNIIYIMSESLSDPKNVDNITLNKNPLENLDEIMNTYTSGTTIAQGYGGGTNMSEFEALTGVSSMFLNNAMFFTNIAQRTTFPSIVSMLEEQGYKTAAIHFSSPLFYNRSIGYEIMGIDYFYNDTELEIEYFDNNKSYSNDDSNYKQILKVVNENKEPTFIHNVTIQNHGPYPFGLSNNDYKVDGLFNEEKKAEAETYFKELEHSDKVLKEFLDELETIDEPTIVVFWGDHLPYFYADEDFGADVLDKYRTPMFIYSNFETPKSEDLGELSMNYISNSLFNKYNFKKPAYYYMIDDLKTKSSVFQANYNQMNPENLYSQYKNGKKIDAETKQLFKDYEAILYDVFEGENYSVELGFYSIEK